MGYVRFSLYIDYFTSVEIHLEQVVLGRPRLIERSVLPKDGLLQMNFDRCKVNQKFF